MVRLRMQRVGRPKTPHFRIVAVDSRKARDAASLEIIGHYHPRENQ
jgi:small subunit ribosomal protein S16